MGTSEMNEEVKEANPASLQKIFGDSSVAKVLDFLTLYREFDYSLTDIAKYSGVAWTTLYRIWPPLETYGIVKKTREIGRAKMYKLNPDSEIAKLVKKLAVEIASVDAEKIAKQEITKQSTEADPAPKQSAKVIVDEEEIVA